MKYHQLLQINQRLHKFFWNKQFIGQIIKKLLENKLIEKEPPDNYKEQEKAIMF
jgi:hypothetical protein